MQTATITMVLPSTGTLVAVPYSSALHPQIEITGGARLGMQVERVSVNDQESYVCLDEALQQIDKVLVLR